MFGYFDGLSIIRFKTLQSLFSSAQDSPGVWRSEILLDPDGRKYGSVHCIVFFSKIFVEMLLTQIVLNTNPYILEDIW